MLFRSVDRWSNIDNLRGLLFFAQRLDELTFPYSLDSYKSPTTSILGLLQEIELLLSPKGGIGDEHAEKAIKAATLVLEEIKVRIKGNWVIAKICGFDRNDFAKLSISLDNFEDVRRQISVIAAELDVEAYISEIAEEVTILSKEKSAKKKLDLLAREFVSLLQHLGVSRDHINSSVVSFFFSENHIGNSDQIKEFCQIVYPHHHTYRILIGVPKIFNTFDEEVLNYYNLTRDPDSLNGIDENEIAGFKELHGNRAYLTCVVEATDYNSAVAEAADMAHSAHSLYRIFSHKDAIEISPTALAEQRCCEGIIKKVSMPQNNMHFIRDMRRVEASSTMKRIKKKITLDLGPDALKFQNMINIHGLSLGSASPDIQLVNLWTCLETIAPSSSSGSKISNVVGRILPTLMLGYYNRLVFQLLFDIVRWNRRALTISLKHCKEGSGLDIKERFIRLIADAENNSALERLLELCRDFELLRFRIFTISELARDSKKSFEKLVGHEEMMLWQIHRIYRTRNTIVHAGSSPNYTKYLVENAHDFFDLSLMFCMELSASKMRFNKFSTCFDFAEREYQSYKSRMKAGTLNNFVWSLPNKKDRSYIFA